MTEPTPPADRAALIRETLLLLAGCVAFVVALGAVVYATTR